MGMESHQTVGHIVAVSDVGIAVATKNSVVVLTELQRPGGKRLDAASLLRGFEVRVGMQFDLTALDPTQPTV